MGGEITAVRPFPVQGLEGRNQKSARGTRHPETGKEAAVVGDVEKNGKGS